MNSVDKNDILIRPRWLNLVEAQNYCPIGERTLIKLIKDGKIRGGQNIFDKRRPWFVDADSIDEFFESMTASGSEEAKIRVLEIIKDRKLSNKSA